MVMLKIVAFIPAVYADALADMVSPDGRIPLPLNVMCKSTLRAFARFVHTDNVYLDILYRIDEDPVCDNIIVLRRRSSSKSATRTM